MTESVSADRNRLTECGAKFPNIRVPADPSKPPMSRDLPNLNGVLSPESPDTLIRELASRASILKIQTTCRVLAYGYNSALLDTADTPLISGLRSNVLTSDGTEKEAQKQPNIFVGHSLEDGTFGWTHGKRDCINRQNPSVLWLRGVPGTGKTSFVSTVINAPNMIILATRKNSSSANSWLGRIRGAIRRKLGGQGEKMLMHLFGEHIRENTGEHNWAWERVCLGQEKNSSSANSWLGGVHGGIPLHLLVEVGTETHGAHDLRPGELGAEEKTMLTHHFGKDIGEHHVGLIGGWDLVCLGWEENSSSVNPWLRRIYRGIPLHRSVEVGNETHGAQDLRPEELGTHEKTMLTCHFEDQFIQNGLHFGNKLMGQSLHPESKCRTSQLYLCRHLSLLWLLGYLVMPLYWCYKESLRGKNPMLQSAATAALCGVILGYYAALVATYLGPNMQRVENRMQAATIFLLSTAITCALSTLFDLRWESLFIAVFPQILNVWITALIVFWMSPEAHRPNYRQFPANQVV